MVPRMARTPPTAQATTMDSTQHDLEVHAQVRVGSLAIKLLRTHNKEATLCSMARAEVCPISLPVTKQ